MQLLILASWLVFASAALGAAGQVLMVPAPQGAKESKSDTYPNAQFTFKNRGEIVSTLSIAQMAERVVPMELTVLDPYSLADEIYRGFPLEALFYAVYREKWRRADNEVIFTLADGKNVSLPGSKVIKYAAYLSFGKKDNSTFAVLNERGGGKPLDLGPFYLIWDNFREPNLKDLGTQDWHVGVVSVDLLDFLDRYPKMIPPKKSSEAAKAGFNAFRKYCVLCHTINGDGGVRGVELNYPISVTEYLSEKWLRKFILEPHKIRFSTPMPPLDRRDPKALRHLPNIIAYLRTMAKNKRPPTERKP